MSGETFIVDTNYGPVRGLKRTSAVGEQYYSLRGIPYAKAPIGDLRFKVCDATTSTMQHIITMLRIKTERR